MKHARAADAVRMLLFPVIAGLDPAIHPFERFFRRLMDARVI
jgi:hypothetical protein